MTYSEVKSGIMLKLFHDDRKRITEGTVISVRFSHPKNRIMEVVLDTGDKWYGYANKALPEVRL